MTGEAVLGGTRAHAAGGEEHRHEAIGSRTPNRREPDVSRPLGDHARGDDRDERPQDGVRKEVPNDVARGHRGRETRIQDASFGRDRSNRPEAAVVVRHLGPEDALQGVARVRRGVVQDHVHPAVNLGGASRVVDLDLLAPDLHQTLDADRLVQSIGVNGLVVVAVGQCGDGLARLPF